jgi:sRNA-binding carbon storage regulator CsrA
MLILTRRPGEGLTIRLDPSVDLRTPVGELLGQGGIRARVAAIHSSQVRFGIDAPVEFQVLRDELIPNAAPTESD